jgi:hypothetical protein
MLAYILALLVGLGSFGLYMTAFFFPEVHRKHDFIWSGVGLFYALVLWVCAGRMTGGVLLGQMAVVALLGWFGWQTILLRRQIAPIDQQTPLPTAADVQVALSNLTRPEGRSQLAQQTSRTFGQIKDGVQGALTAAKQSRPVPAPDTYVPPQLEEFGTAGQEAIARFAKVAIPQETSVSEVAGVVQDAVEEAVADLQTLDKNGQDTVTTAATAASRAIAQVQPAPPNLFATLQQQASDLIKRLTATVQSQRPESEQSPTIQPPTVSSKVSIAEVQAPASQPYVRKKFREESSDTPPTQPYVRKKFREESSEASSSQPSPSQPYVRKKYRDAASETPSSQPYVRKKYRDAAPTETQETKGVYVRKKYRQDATADVGKPEPAPPDVMDATVISVSEAINRTADGSLVAEAVIEIESDTLAPDLLANAMPDLLADAMEVTSTADPNATVEDIVEELLEDISVQEVMVSHSSNPASSPEAIPPHPPSPEIVEAAIANAEEKGLPFDPPDAEKG